MSVDEYPLNEGTILAISFRSFAFSISRVSTICRCVLCSTDCREGSPVAIILQRCRRCRDSACAVVNTLWQCWHEYLALIANDASSTPHGVFRIICASSRLGTLNTLPQLIHVLSAIDVGYIIIYFNSNGCCVTDGQISLRQPLYSSGCLLVRLMVLPGFVGAFFAAPV